MKKILCTGFCVFLAMLFSINLMAADYAAEADRLFDQGGLQNFSKAIDLYRRAIAENSDSYEANWKCARVYRKYADEAKSQKIEGWQDICAEYGKEGMRYGRKAIELDPSKPDGHYYYGLSVGVYSDGVSVFTALAEGLKDKTQSSFEKTYEIDKMYNHGGPMLSLGRFWAILPWPLRDRKKSLKYFREYQATAYFTDNIEAHLYLGELLIQMGGDKNQAEAKGYLEIAAQSDTPYFKEKANELLKQID